MTIGEKIKKLRREQGITQEKLADYLNISYQAVSKWENNTALPDISLVVPISNFFGVATDVLFDLEDKSDEEDIAEYEKKSRELANKGKIRDLVELWREAAGKYPKNYHCLYLLASSLNLSIISTGFDKEESDKNAKEGIAICKRILEDCTDDEIRANTRHQLVFMYNYIGDEENAVECAEKGASIYTSRENMLVHAYRKDNPKKREAREKSALHDIYSFTWYISSLTDDPAAAVNAGEILIELWDTLLGLENLLYQHYMVYNLYLHLARSYCLLGDKAAAIDRLKKAKHQVELYESIPEGEHHYSGPFFSSCIFDKSKTAKNYEDSEIELFSNQIKKSKDFDILRDEKEYIELMASFN